MSDLQTPSRTLPALAALNGLLAIAIGAFAAHGITDPQAKQWINTGVTFQLPQAAAVFALLGWRDERRVRAVAWLVAAGSFVFAASLYALALGAPRWSAAFAPIGGTAMIAGWAWLAVVALRPPIR
ncbi:DUF423 domain-containing protein [Sphingosinicellaceae bacterium]|nr:DUF423 domain-containing protein [Sphingosinicellaceae bacterium]